MSEPQIPQRTMTENRRNQANLVAMICIAACQVLIAPPTAWALSRVVDHGERIVKIETAVTTFLGEGPRYTERDAERDVGVIMRVLDRHEAELTEVRKRVESMNR